MPTGSDPVSTLTLIMSSAVVSAGVNVGWSMCLKLIERRKEAQKVDHVYLAIATQLEAFARRCNERLYDISSGVERYRTHGDSSLLNNLMPVPFEFTPEPDWTALPVRFVAKVRALPNRFEQCNAWINAAFKAWAELDDAYELDEERLAFYAIKACNLASEIRTKIKAGDGEVDDLVEHFRSILNKRRNMYRQYPGVHSFIPELRAQFESEHPISPEASGTGATV